MLGEDYTVVFGFMSSAGLPMQALLEDGKFCGLPLDQDNEDDKTEDRIKGWIAQLKSEGF
jgi:flavodoxin I